MTEDLEKLYPVKIEKSGETYDLHVMWSIHNKCNYSCSYCPDVLHDGSLGWLKLDILKGFIDKIHSHYVGKLGYKNILFSFTGGEPTLWPEFREFIKHINARGFKIGLTTNASVAVNYWKHVSTFFDYICLSFHPESADVDEFLKRFEYLHNAEKTVIPSVRIMMHQDPKLWKKGEELVEKLKKFPNWTYECVHILDDYGQASVKVDYGSPEKEEFLKENAFKFQFKDNDFVHLPDVNFNYQVEYTDHTVEKLDENKLINNNHANFEGWDCYIGLEQLFIQFNGLVKRAGCNVGEHLGNVLEYENIVFPSKPVPCTRNTCHCPTDIRISKYAKGVEHKPKEVSYSFKKTEVGDENSPFDLRVNAFVDEFHSDVNTYIEKVFEVAKTQAKNLKIEEEKIFVQFHFEPGFDAKLVNFELLKTDIYTAVQYNIKTLEDLDTAEMIFENFNHSTFCLSELFGIKPVLKLLHKSQSDFTRRMVLEVNKSEKIDGRVLAGFITLLYNYDCTVHFLGFEKAIEAKEADLNSGMTHVSRDKVQGRWTYRKHKHYSLNTTDRRNFFIENDNVKVSDGQVYRMSNQNFVGCHFYKGWECEMGMRAFVVLSDGKVQSSQCGQAVDMGSIYGDVKFLTKPTKCDQNICKNIIDELIKKKLSS